MSEGTCNSAEVGSPVDIDFLRVRDVQHYFGGHVSEGASVTRHLTTMRGKGHSSADDRR